MLLTVLLVLVYLPAAVGLAAQAAWATAALFGVNLLGLVLYATDKTAAQRQRARVPETVFYLLALAGGAAGCALGRQLFNHKTRKALFGLLNWAGVAILWVSWGAGYAA